MLPRWPHLLIAASCLVLLASSLAWAAPAGPASAGVPFQVQRGVNLSHWFSQLFGDMKFGPEHAVGKYSDDEFKALRAMGFDHVRVPVEPELVAADGGFGAIDDASFALLEQAIRRLLAADLAVIVDCHPKASFKKALTAEPASVERAAQWWEETARRLSWTDPSKVAFQLLNEPTISKSADWQPIQEALAAGARRGAPGHTLIATGHAWSDISTLIELQPLADRNVIYAFHMYRSATFTHQGATWGNAKWADLKGVPYPSSPERIAPLADELADPEARKLLEDYGQKNWDAKAIDSLVAEAANWAEKHDVSLICTEFGVYKPYAAPADRAAWLRDSRTAFETYNIPWTMWDYRHGFGLIDGTTDQATLSKAILTALGLSRKDVPSWISVTD